jgi:hypothetical protein
VSVALSTTDPEASFAAFAGEYFSQFVATSEGMSRKDPQDKGPGYRPVVGIPGGVDGALFPLLQAANVHGMQLVPGTGDGDGDRVNQVHVYDSGAFPFHQAEVYHQFHNGIGFETFPAEYTEDLKRELFLAGALQQTGCPVRSSLPLAAVACLALSPKP